MINQRVGVLSSFSLFLIVEACLSVSRPVLISLGTVKKCILCLLLVCSEYCVVFFRLFTHRFYQGTAGVDAPYLEYFCFPSAPSTSHSCFIADARKPLQQHRPMIACQAVPYNTIYVPKLVKSRVNWYSAVLYISSRKELDARPTPKNLQ